MLLFLLAQESGSGHCYVFSSSVVAVQSGVVSGCDAFDVVQTDDGCWAIVNDNDIALADFYAWNLGV